jgi:hypothetical protein
VSEARKASVSQQTSGSALNFYQGPEDALQLCLTGLFHPVALILMSGFASEFLFYCSGEYCHKCLEVILDWAFQTP